jgi:membrane protein YqaA with SNARE-associated domain
MLPVRLDAALAISFAVSRLLALLSSLGLVGVFLISIVDSSFVPLPVPGVTDILVILFAARHVNVFALVAVATCGSALGGLFSHMVGQAGGMAFLEQRVPARILQPVTRWMNEHALLAISVPAILPPPMPLSPFVLAAGALHMSRRRFVTAFTLSRLARHSIAAWLGLRYGRNVLHLWARFTARWGEPVLIVLWTVILAATGFAFWKLYRTSKTLDIKPVDALRRTSTSVPPVR